MILRRPGLISAVTAMPGARLTILPSTDILGLIESYPRHVDQLLALGFTAFALGPGCVSLAFP